MAVLPTRTSALRAISRAGGQDNGKLLLDFAVAGVKGHVLRIGIDPGQPGDLAVNACARCWIGTAAFRRLAGLGADCGSGPALRS
jgi:hypothetical protein